jgi:hypothetical protein
MFCLPAQPGHYWKACIHVPRRGKQEKALQTLHAAVIRHPIDELLPAAARCWPSCGPLRVRIGAGMTAVAGPLPQKRLADAHLPLAVPCRREGSRPIVGRRLQKCLPTLPPARHAVFVRPLGATAWQPWSLPCCCQLPAIAVTTEHGSQAAVPGRDPAQALRPGCRGCPKRDDSPSHPIRAPSFSPFLTHSASQQLSTLFLTTRRQPYTLLKKPTVKIKFDRYSRFTDRQFFKPRSR